MISIDESRCTLCGLCVPVCVRRILEMREKSVAVLDPALCIFCGHCKAVCPADAPRFSNLSEAEFEPAPTAEEIPNASPFLRFLRRRRSLRVYKSRPVEMEKLQMIVEAGRFAPTGGNRQGCEFVVVSKREVLDHVCTLTVRELQAEGERVKEALDRLHRLKEPLPEKYISKQTFPPVWDRIAQKWGEGVDQIFHHAPALVVIHVKKGTVVTPEMDAGLAAMQMVLVAETLGLGTCFIGFLIFALENSKELQEALRVPTDHQAYVAFTVGYPGVDFLKLVARNPAKVAWIDKVPE